MKHLPGFTLIEFIITMVIAAIIVGFVVPGFYNMIQNNKISAAVNKFSASLNYARSEAIKRSIKVSVCPAANANLNTCGNATQWVNGWIVFLDEDNDNAIDGTSDLLRLSEAVSGGAVITTSSGIVNYDATGFVSSGTFSAIFSAKGCTGTNAKNISLTSSGRLTVSAIACP